MTATARPKTEIERLAELESFAVVGTPAEDEFDAITYLASQTCDAPMALVTLVTEDRLWFKSRQGLRLTEMGRTDGFCGHVVEDPAGILIVPDAAADPRFTGSPLVTGEMGVRFYAGAPLVTQAGNVVGALSVMDQRPRTLTPAQEKSLAALANQVVALLELRRTLRELEEQRGKAAASAQRDTFMAAVSHEIRGPLTTVIGYIDLLRKDLPEADRAEVLESVAREAADVEYLIEDLLVSARAEAESLRIAAVPVRLSAQIAQVLEGLDPGQEGHIALDLVESRAVGDPARVRQIVRNLVTNALRYGGPSVSVATSVAGDMCHVTVCDNGRGIPEGERDLVFEQFGQASASRHVADSVGLGLPISRLLAERMGGSLTYHYVDGMSVFDLALPHVVADPD